VNNTQHFASVCVCDDIKRNIIHNDSSSSSSNNSLGDWSSRENNEKSALEGRSKTTQYKTPASYYCYNQQSTVAV